MSRLGRARGDTHTHCALPSLVLRKIRSRRRSDLRLTPGFDLSTALAESHPSLRLQHWNPNQNHEGFTLSTPFSCPNSSLGITAELQQCPAAARLAHPAPGIESGRRTTRDCPCLSNGGRGRRGERAGRRGRDARSETLAPGSILRVWLRSGLAWKRSRAGLNVPPPPACSLSLFPGATLPPGPQKRNCSPTPNRRCALQVVFPPAATENKKQAARTLPSVQFRDGPTSLRASPLWHSPVSTPERSASLSRRPRCSPAMQTQAASPLLQGKSRPNVSRSEANSPRQLLASFFPRRC